MGCLETSVIDYQEMLRNIPEERSHLHSGEICKSHKVVQLVKNFHTLRATRRFTTVFTRAYGRALS